MALILDETFATSIPGGFATTGLAWNANGSLGVSYNSTAQAVDLVRAPATTGFGIWKLSTVPALAEVDIEVDMEIRVISNTAGFGFAFDRSGATGVLSTLLYQIFMGVTNFSEGHVAAVNDTNNPWYPNAGEVSRVPRGLVQAVGSRRLFRASTKVQAGRRWLRATLDGVEFSRVYDMGPDTVVDALLRPQIMVQESTCRIHGIKVWDSVADYTLPVPAPFATEPTLFPLQGPSTSGPIGGYATKDLVIQQRLPGRFSGKGVFEGVVTIETTTFASRLVRMYDKNTGLLVDQTWSAPVTGAYRFENFDETREYFFVAHDHLRVYNGVISDMLVV
jgi:hypothetical protein